MNKKVSKSLQVVIITILLKIYILYYSNELKRYILILTKCMGGALFFGKAFSSFIFAKRVVCLDMRTAEKVVT